VFNLSQNKIEIAAKHINFRTKRTELSTISPPFVLYNSESGLANLLAFCKLAIITKVFCQVLKSENISWIALKSLLEILGRSLPGLMVI